MRRVNLENITLKNRLKLELVFFVWKAKNLLLKIIQSIFSKNTTTEIKKILIYRGGSVGDSVCALPAILFIKEKFNNAEIDIITTPLNNSYISIDKIISDKLYNKCINYGGKVKNIFKNIKGEDYDLLIMLPGRRDSERFQFLAPILFRFKGVKKSFGWKIDHIGFFKRIQEEYLEFDNEIDRLLNILKENDIPISTNYNFPLNIKENDIIKVESMISKLPSLNKNQESIGLVLGANQRHKEWGRNNYFILAKYLLDSGFNVFLIGGEKEKEQSIYFKGVSGVYDFCGKFSIIQSTLLLKRCKIVISNDTGPMHLTYASNVPLIAIFSTWDFSGQWFPPQNDKTVIIRPPLISCSICLKQICPNNNECIQLVKPYQVINEFEKLIIRLS